MNKLLSINNISKSYYSLEGETKAISNISFDIDEGDFACLIGPSGCGKSTILNIIAGLDKDYDGSIDKSKNLVISYMTQDDSLFPWLSVFDNATLGLKIKKIDTIENIRYVDNLLDKYGLKEFKNAKISSLSGGMRQRVALIRTLAIRPDLILLDEPFCSLDYVSRIKISNDVKNIIKNEKVTALMVSHDALEVVSMSDKVIVLSNRPSFVKKIYYIKDVNKSIPINNLKDKDFVNYLDMIWKDIDDYE